MIILPFNRLKSDITKSMEEISNNCDLVGPVGILVQAILIILIFTAVKSRLGSPSQAPLRKAEEDPQAFFHGRHQTAHIERHAARGKRGDIRLRRRPEAERPVRDVVSRLTQLPDVADHRRHARTGTDLLPGGHLEPRALENLHLQDEERKLLQRSQERHEGVLHHRLCRVDEANLNLAYVGHAGRRM